MVALQSKVKIRMYTRGELERIDSKRRLGALSEKIRTYDPDFNLRKLEIALAWSKKRFKSPKVSTINDLFSDPLLIAERLVSYTKADHETLLASVLYPSVRPLVGNNVDVRGLDEIQEIFGLSVRSLVERTLRLRSLEHLPLSATAKQSPQEQLSLFNLMTLLMAEDPRAIAIRVTQRTVNTEMEIKKKEVLPREVRAQWAWQARYISAPTAYLAGYSLLRQELLDKTYRLENPQAYADDKRTLDNMGSYKITDEDIEKLKESIAELVQNEAGINSNLFTVEVRKKRPASARDKANRKGQTIEQLGDRLAFRIVLSVTEGDPNFNINYLDPHERDALLHKFGGQCHKVYALLSQKYGRGSRSAELKKEFTRLAIEDPHPERRGVDARFDDYIKNPKDSGYSAIHDTFFVMAGEKCIELEGQIVDEIRHEVNTYGPRASHIFYKTGLSDHADIVLEWREHARSILEGDDNVEQSHVAVFDEENQIFIAETGFTVQDFMRRVYGEEIADQVIGVSIDNVALNTDGQGRNPNVSYGPLERLRTGDRISNLQIRNG